jgi:hypothetical protein
MENVGSLFSVSECKLHDVRRSPIIESQENKSQEQPLPNKEQHELEEEQLEGITGGVTITEIVDGRKIVTHYDNALAKRKRNASEAGMTNYVLDTKIPRIGNMKDVSGKNYRQK